MIAGRSAISRAEHVPVSELVDHLETAIAEQERASPL